MRFNTDSLTPALPRIHSLKNHRRRPRANCRIASQLGLAAMLDDPEQTIACGGLTLVPNSNVRWLAMHRMPGHRHGSHPPVRRVTVARACLRFGMPTLSFAERPGAPANVMRVPISNPSIRAIADRLSASLAGDGAAIDGNRTPGCCFPQAYLGFPTWSADDLFRLATREQSIGRTLPCRGCGRDIDVARLFPGDSGHASGLAECPVCRRVQRWPLGDAVPTRFTRHVPIGFIRRFCMAIADRLPLRATGPSTYCGSRPLSPVRDWPNLPNARTRRLDLLAHEFCCTLTGELRFVYLPRFAEIEARLGQRLDVGQVWCHVLTSPPDAAWRSLPRPVQYTAADRVLGGDALADHLKRVWFDHQGITCEELGEHQRLWPADLVAFAAGGTLRPLGLYWGFARAHRQVQTRLAAAVFPRVHARRGVLPGDVAFDASFAVRSPRPSRPSDRPRHRALPITSAATALVRQAC